MDSERNFEFHQRDLRVFPDIPAFTFKCSECILFRNVETTAKYCPALSNCRHQSPQPHGHHLHFHRQRHYISPGSMGSYSALS